MSDFLRELQAHPVVMRDPQTLRYIRQLQSAHPVAIFHRKVLELIGSDFTFAQADTADCWAAVIELNSELQRLFGLNRGILAYYAPYSDLQLMTFERLQAQRLERPFHNHLYFLSTPDIYAERKVSGWTLTEPFSVVQLPNNGTPKDAARQLLTEMIRQVSRRNPYERTNPVTGHDFYGRSRLLTDLVDDLRQGHVCGVFGLRKTGKTSLVTELGRQFVKDDVGNRVFILRDLEVLPSDPDRQIPQLVSDIAKQAHTSFRNAGMRTHELSRLPAYPAVGELRQALQACLTNVGSQGKTVVIALDEIESLVGPDASSTAEKPSVAEFLGALRSLVQENPNFNVVISGITLAPLRNATLYGRENPLFAWAKPFFVTALTRSDTNEMIRSLGARMAVQWEDGALKILFDITGGHVFLARSLAAEVSGELSLRIEERTVTEDDVRAQLRSWRRSTAGIIDSMLDALARFYEEELTVLDLGIAGTPFDELELEYPNQINNLLALGLLEEKAEDLQLTPWVQLSSRSAPRSSR